MEPVWVASAGLVALTLAALGVWLRVRPRPDPRAGSRTSPGTPVWFERADGRHVVPPVLSATVDLGSAADPPVPGAEPLHARVRVFGRDLVDLVPLGGAVRVDGARARGPVALAEGSRIRLGRVELVAHVGWQPDPDDARIGTVAAGERLWSRVAPGRYHARDVTVALLSPPVGPVAYEARIRAAEALCPELGRVRRVEADAVVIEGLEPPPRQGPLPPPALFAIARALTPLHRAGIGHGGLRGGVLYTWSGARLGPVAPEGTVVGDAEVLRGRLPERWAGLRFDDAPSLALALLREDAARRAAPRPWTPDEEDPFAAADRDEDRLEPMEVGRCDACGELAAVVGPAATATMMDGRRADGSWVGGRISVCPTECLACGDRRSVTRAEGW